MTNTTENNGEVQHSLADIIAKAKLVLEEPDPEIIQIARESTPTATYKRVLRVIPDLDTAKAARWLAVLRRNHGDKVFEETVSSFSKWSQQPCKAHAL